MLTRQPNIPHIICMQISAVIIDQSICHYISATITDNWQNEVYRPMFLGSANIIIFLGHDHMCLWQFNMQIRAAIIEKSIVHHILANTAHNSTNKVSRLMFSGSTIIKGSLLNWLRVSLACYAISNVPALPKMWFSSLYLSQYCKTVERVFYLRNHIVFATTDRLHRQ